MPDLMFNSVKRITDASPKDREMMREAVRGQGFEPGKYLRDMGTGALAGGAGGAIAGGGIGSLPGAAVGAIGGAVFGLGSNLASDVAYAFYGDESKAAWQAGDIEDHLNKMGGWINSKTQDPTMGQFLSSLGASYKNYIDVSVNKVDSEDHLKGFKENIFNPQSSAYASFQQALSQQQQPQRPVQSQSSRFVRIAYEDSAAGLAGGTGAAIGTQKVLDNLAPAAAQQVSNIPLTPELIVQFLKDESSVSPPIKAQIQRYFQSNPKAAQDYARYLQLSDYEKLLVTNRPITNPSEIVFGGTDDVANQAGKNLLKPSNLLSTAWKGVKGLGAGLVVDLASNWALDKIDMMMTGGEIQMFRRELQEVGKIITEVNRLTNNKEDVVYAGNILWTNLKEVDRMLEAVEVNKAQQPNPSTPPTEPRQNAASTKFVRLK